MLTLNHCTSGRIWALLSHSCIILTKLNLISWFIRWITLSKLLYTALLHSHPNRQTENTKENVRKNAGSPRLHLSFPIVLHSLEHLSQFDMSLRFPAAFCSTATYLAPVVFNGCPSLYVVKEDIRFETKQEEDELHWRLLQTLLLLSSHSPARFHPLNQLLVLGVRFLVQHFIRKPSSARRYSCRKVLALTRHLQ